MGRPGSTSLDQARANLAHVAHTLQDKQGLQGHGKASKAYLAGQLRLTWTHAGGTVTLLDSSFLLQLCPIFSVTACGAFLLTVVVRCFSKWVLQAALGQNPLQLSVHLPSEHHTS